MQDQLNSIENKVVVWFKAIDKKIQSSIDWNANIITLIETNRMANDKITEQIRIDVAKLETRLDSHDVKHVRLKIALIMITMIGICAFLGFSHFIYIIYGIT